MEKTQEINKFSKMRLMLALCIGVFILYHSIELIENLTRVSQFSGGNYINYSDFVSVILLFIGTILFALNRKWTDYISFSIFIFLFGGVVPFQFVEAGCLESDNFNICIQNLFFSKGTLILLLISSHVVFLILSFIKRLEK